MVIPTRTWQKPAVATEPLKVASVVGDVLTLAVAIGASFSVHLVGELYVSEIILLPLLPILIAIHPRRISRPGLKVGFVLIGLWLFGLVMTDLYRSTAVTAWLREYANIAFLVIDIMGLAVLLGGNPRRQAVFIGGFAFGALLAAWYQPSLWFEDDPWKFGYSIGANLGVVFVSCYFYRRHLYAIVGYLLFAIMAVNLLMNFRGEVLNLLVTVALVLPIIPERMGRIVILPPAGSTARVLVLALIAVSAAFAAKELVNFVTTAGLISNEAQTKNELESQSAVGMLIGGRPEILVSARAIWDSPILGHGSAARDYKYIEMLSDLEAKYGQPLDLSDIEENSKGLIPTHSHLLDAWVKAGILGPLFWIYVWWMAVKSVVKVAMDRPPLAPVYVFILIGLIWDILFSPFGGTRRITVALAVIIIFDILKPLSSSRKRGKVSHVKRWRRFSVGDRAYAPHGHWTRPSKILPNN